MMRTVIILATLCVAYVTAHRRFMNIPEVAEAFERCKNAGFGKDLEGEAVDDRTNCMSGCMAKELGLFTNGKANIDRMREVLNSGDNPHPERAEKMLEDVEKCREESEVSEDDCVVAKNYLQCLRRFRPRGGPHHRPDNE